MYKRQVYTPLKRISWINTLVGAIPGALPVLGGWLATETPIHIAIIAVFFSLFSWQIPHFYALSIMYLNEYKNAGFKMLFGGKKNSYPAAIAIFTSSLMTLVSLVAYFYIDSLSLSTYSFVVVLFLGIWFTLKSVNLYQKTNDIAARKLMLASFLYLPLVQVVYVLDRFLS